MTTTAQFPADCARKFRPERLLGSGGYGQVWLAHQIELERRVVVKLLHAETAAQPEQVERFKNEAQVTALLRHPHIVLVLDYGADDGLPWIAYEFIEGRSLRARLDAGAMPWRDACTLGVQVASALEAAHQRGILHRDIKPDNVLEAGPDDWKVADFGIAKWSGSAVKTEAGMVLGTPAYLSPQQLRGLVPAFESDVYALGVMLYEAVAGKLPWWDENLALLLQRRLTIAAPAPSAAQSGVPLELDRLILKMIAPQREDRIANAAEVRTALERILGERPSQRTRALSRPASRATGRAVTGLSAVQPAPEPARSRLHLAAAAAVAFAVIGSGVWLSMRSPQPQPSPTPAPVTSPTAPAASPAAVDPTAIRREIQATLLQLKTAFRPVFLKRMEKPGPEQVAGLLQASKESLRLFRELVRRRDTSDAWMDLMWLIDQCVDNGIALYPQRHELANASLRNIARAAGEIPPGVFPGVFRAVVVPRIEVLLTYQGDRNSERLIPVYEAASSTIETAASREWQESFMGLAHRAYLASEVLYYARRKELHYIQMNIRSQPMVDRAEKVLVRVERIRSALAARPAALLEDPDAAFALGQALRGWQGVLDTGAANRSPDALDRAQQWVDMPLPPGLPRVQVEEIEGLKERLRERVVNRRK